MGRGEREGRKEGGRRVRGIGWNKDEEREEEGE